MSELRTYQDLAYGVEPTVSTVGFAKTTWHYDGQRGWLTEKNYDGEAGDGPGGAADYTYTLAGRLKTRTWERGVVTTYGYDQGSLESVVYSNDPTGTAGVTYTYDAFGRSSTVGQGGNLHTYGYDAGSLMLDTETIAYDTDGNGAADFTRVLDMTQDALLRATGHWLKDGAAIENAVVYTYDGAGRLQTVGGAGQSGSAGFAYEYETNAVALLKKVIGPVHTVTNGYEDHRNVLANKENMNAAGTNVISEFTYTTNSIGQRTHLTTSGSAYTSAPVYSWAYNGRGELIEASDTSSANNDRAFQYDGIGNREKTVDGLLPALPALPNYAATSQNQYASIGALSPSYDADGNATGYPLPAAPGQLSTLVWNGENRLISATVAGTTSTYSYDYRGRRISKQVGAAPATRYIYEGWNVIAEYTGSTLDRSYTWGMDLSGSMQVAGGVGGLLAVHIGTENYFPTYDGNGNVGEYLDASGAVAAHFEYDAFGNETVSTSSAGAPTFAHRFSTKPLDGETGLYYYGFRYLESIAGRWLSRDPLLESGGLGIYSFCNNMVEGWVDRLGLEGGSLAEALGFGPTSSSPGQAQSGSGLPLGRPLGTVACAGCHGTADGSWSNIAGGEKPGNVIQGNMPSVLDGPGIYDQINILGLRGKEGEEDYTDWFEHRFPGTVRDVFQGFSDSIDKRIQAWLAGGALSFEGIKWSISPGQFAAHGDNPQTFYERNVMIGSFVFYLENVQIYYTPYGSFGNWSATVYAEEITGANPPNDFQGPADLFWFTGGFVQRHVRMAEWEISKCEEGSGE